MILLIPMAGNGQRFKDAGFKTVKPFIDVKGQWMVDWALKGFDLSKFRKIIFLVRMEHNEEVGATGKLREKYGAKCVSLIVNHSTQGAACTVLLAKDHISTDED